MGLGSDPRGAGQGRATGPSGLEASRSLGRAGILLQACAQSPARELEDGHHQSVRHVCRADGTLSVQFASASPALSHLFSPFLLSWVRYEILQSHCNPISSPVDSPITGWLSAIG